MEGNDKTRRIQKNLLTSQPEKKKKGHKEEEEEEGEFKLEISFSTSRFSLAKWETLAKVLQVSQLIFHKRMLDCWFHLN